jgi:hypothetical protein
MQFDRATDKIPARRGILQVPALGPARDILMENQSELGTRGGERNTRTEPAHDRPHALDLAR